MRIIITIALTITLLVFTVMKSEAQPTDTSFLDNLPPDKRERLIRLVRYNLDVELDPPDSNRTLTETKDMLARLNISIPETPDHFDLRKEFAWIQHLQNIAVFVSSNRYHDKNSPPKKRVLPGYRLCFLILSQDRLIQEIQKTYSSVSFEEMQKLWKEKWDIDVPDMVHVDEKFRDLVSWSPTPSSPLFEYFNPELCGYRRNVIEGRSPLEFVHLSSDRREVLLNEFQISMKEQRYQTTCYRPRQALSSIKKNRVVVPDDMELLVFSRDNGEGIYLVAGYHRLDEDVFERYEFNPSTIRLRYVFMGYLPPVYLGGIKRAIPTFTTSAYQGDKKGFDDGKFSPTGVIFYIDDQGHPTNYFSFLNGKYFGMQISWNQEGRVVTSTMLADPKESCADSWIEFRTDM